MARQLGMMMVAVAVAALPLGLHAQTKPKAEPQPSAAPSATAPTACPVRCVAPQSALDTVARSLAGTLARVPGDVEVVTVALQSDVQAPRGEALAGRLAALVAGRLGAAAKHQAAPTTLEAARKATTAQALVVLTPSLVAGRLVVAADAYPIPRSIWSRARAPQPGPLLHGQASAPLDAEVRTYLAPLALPKAPTVTKLTQLDEGVLALACGDLDGDGASEVVSVNRQRVAAWKLGDKTPMLQSEATWDTLSPIAPVPLRQPIALATIVEGPTSMSRRGYVDVALTDRRDSQRLSPLLKPLATMKGKAVPNGRGSACTWVHDLRLGQKLIACHESDAPPALPNLQWPSDAIASTVVVAVDGRVTPTVALRRDNTLLVRAPDDAGEPADRIVARVGAQIAIGDLDQDGAPELVSALDVGAPRLDAIEVRSLASGKAQLRYRLPVPTGVEAVAVCPPDAGTTVAATVVATKGELWVVR